MFVKPVVKPEFVADCHLTIVPVFPDNVNPVEFVPVHTVALPAILPPTDAALTVTVIALVYTVSFPVVTALLL